MINQVINYYWEDEKKNYEEFLFENYEKFVLEEFNKLNLEDKNNVIYWLNTEYGTNHIFMILLELKNQINE